MAVLVALGLTACGTVTTDTGLSDDLVLELVVVETTAAAPQIRELNGTVVSGTIEVAVRTTGTIDAVAFYVDDAKRAGEPLVRVEAAPFTATLDTTEFTNGVHELTAVTRTDAGREKSATARFEVRNGAETPSEPGTEPAPAPAPAPSPELPWGATYDLPAATLYVATNGSDSNSGRTADRPLRTLTRAAAVVQPGDVVYIRGGIYPIQVSFRTDGTADRPIVWASYPGEWAILDGSDQEDYVSPNRMWVDGASFNHFVNFEVRNGPRQGIYVRNSTDNLFHALVSHGHHGSGVANLDSHRNRYEYLVVHNNFDQYDPDGMVGQDADGIGISSGDGNVLYRVVSFNNSDDGIDAWLSTNTIIDECVSFDNGRGTHGNGNGFKAGGRGTANYTIVRNSIAFDNRASGFTQNSGLYISFFNNTSYRNGGPAFVAGSTITLRNNVAIGGSLSVSGSDQRANSWNLGIQDVRAVSLDPAHDGFLALRSDSPAIGAGVDVGLPYAGGAPDLGALPYGVTLADVIDPRMVDIGIAATTGALDHLAAAY